MYWLTVTRWPAMASGSCVTGRNAGLRGGTASSRPGWARPVLGLGRVAADTDLVTLQLPIATGGGHMLPAQEAANHR
jgi:hypothetical protein